MWTRKDIRRNARGVVKKHYWAMVVLCMILAYFMHMYAENGTLWLIQAYSEERGATQLPVHHTGGTSNTEIVDSLVDRLGTTNVHTTATKGALSTVINSVGEAGSVLFGILNMVNQLFFGDSIMYGIVIAVGVLLGFLTNVFVQNPVRVSGNRFFLEATNYEKVPLTRLLFVFQTRKTCNVGIVMFFKQLYQVLWSLTVVGIFIKFYSYMMIPFILAENPGVTKKQAFALSRTMMHGNKWEAFKLSLSFMGWRLLAVATGGLVAIFYLNPYITATRAELYYRLRQKAIENQIEYYECFNDIYLEVSLVIERNAYPEEALSLSRRPFVREFKHDYRRDYSIRSLILLFFTFSVIGWLWEVSLHLSRDGFVNRGVQQGPWLPIYGAGGVIVLLLLKKLREKPLLTFVGTIVLCGTLEYVSSYLLEVTHGGTKWWDYSGYFLNLNGRICAEGLLVFGLGGTAFIYYAAPAFDDLYKKIPVKFQMILCILLLSTFTTDALYSIKHPNTGKGITDYKARRSEHDIIEHIYQINNVKKG